MNEDAKEFGENETCLSDRGEFEEGSMTYADQVSIRTGDNIKNDEGDSHSMRAELRIGKDGGTLDIQNTGVNLKIPPGALQRDYCIQMRIIPHHETQLSFASNSSVVVELLPNNVKLLKPATLTLPHYLVLKKKCGWKAKGYSSHHKEGTRPQWEEERNAHCDVTYETCVMQLNNFSWKKVDIGEQTVQAKRIMLYAAMRSSIENEICFDIGYYWDLPGCQKVVKLNHGIVLQEIPTIFFKDGQLPLTISFERVVPPNWTITNEEKKEISFRTVAISVGSFCTFILNKMPDETDRCECYFKAGQGTHLVDLRFSLRAPIVTFSNLKEELSLRLTQTDCEKLGCYFSLPPNQLQTIITSPLYSENFLLALEEKGCITPSNVNRLTAALTELKIHDTHLLTETYMKLRDPETEYDRFLASLAAHLTMSITAKICDNFKVTDDNKKTVISSQNPGLSFLLKIDEMGIIHPSDVSKLETPLQEYRLLQAVAKIHEYQSLVLSDKTKPQDEGIVNSWLGQIYQASTPGPMLKIESFGEDDRSDYIKKVYSGDQKRQEKLKELIDDIPFILDLCNVPLLFVMLVHNIDRLGKLKVRQLDRATPFVKAIVDILCPVQDKEDNSGHLSHQKSYISLEELAFNGLCKGNQQLFWQKDFVDRRVTYSKAWIDSGILVVEEGTPFNNPSRDLKTDSGSGSPQTDSISDESLNASSVTSEKNRDIDPDF
ncbi:hypothetical protein BSL78_23410 [Apostichopus japonicus]|uniref:Netrin receptor UNC5 n=1 Tax=Stichopus japonicus TaxID=307972 RepID=A0A2G8JVI2_STIJA|nr:hypothetical protein BSL78_23410 [Apostichopus japonicus]